MTRSEAIKAFFFKSVLPVIVALILYCIFKSACVKNGEVDYVWLWILCGLPFGLHRMCLWIVPGGGVPFPVSWTVKMKKKQKETQDILSYHSQAAGCSDKARAKASGGRQPIEECGRTGL